MSIYCVCNYVFMTIHTYSFIHLFIHSCIHLIIYKVTFQEIYSEAPPVQPQRYKSVLSNLQNTLSLFLYMCKFICMYVFTVHRRLVLKERRLLTKGRHNEKATNQKNSFKRIAGIIVLNKQHNERTT